MKGIRKFKSPKAGGLKLIRGKGSIFGVCAGLSEYFGIEVRNIRIGFAALTAISFLMGGGLFKLLGVGIYAILAAALPRESSAREEIRREFSPLEEEEVEKQELQDSLRVCPNCNTVSKPQSAFCHECGTRL